MMGISCDDLTSIYGDNQLVLANTTIPDSTLKKKSQSITYHFVHEGASRDEWQMTYVNTHENEADLLTKQLPSGEKRKSFFSKTIAPHLSFIKLFFGDLMERITLWAEPLSVCVGGLVE